MQPRAFADATFPQLPLLESLGSGTQNSKTQSHNNSSVYLLSICFSYSTDLFTQRHLSRQTRVDQHSNITKLIMNDYAPPVAEPEMVRRGWFHRARPAMIPVDEVPEYRVRSDIGTNNFIQLELLDCVVHVSCACTCIAVFKCTSLRGCGSSLCFYSACEPLHLVIMRGSCALACALFTMHICCKTPHDTILCFLHMF